MMNAKDDIVVLRPTSAAEAKLAKNPVTEQPVWPRWFLETDNLPAVGTCYSYEHGPDSASSRLARALRKSGSR